MQIYLAAVLVLFLKGQVSQAGEGCCHPDRVMGEALHVERQTRFYFAIDYKAGRLYRTSDRAKKDWYNVIDYAGKQMLTSHDGNCSVTDYPEAVRHVQCMTEKQNIGSYQQGDAYNPVYVDTYSYEMSGTRVIKTVTRQGKLCFPMNVHVSKYGVNRTLIYSNLQPFIDSNEIYSSFHGCTKLKKTKPSYASKQADESKGDKYFMDY